MSSTPSSVSRASYHRLNPSSWSSGYSEVTGGTNQRRARDVTRCRACRPTSGKKPTTKATASSARSVTAVAPPSTWCSTVTMSRTKVIRYTAVA